jgi:hypothetical protein
VPTEAQEYDGMFHVFPILMPWLGDSKDVFRRLKGFIHKLVAGAPEWSDAELRRRLGQESSAS